MFILTNAAYPSLVLCRRYEINETHVSTKQQCARPPTKSGPCNPRNVKALSRIFPLGAAKWGPLEIPVPRDGVLVHALDIEVDGQEYSPSF